MSAGAQDEFERLAAKITAETAFRCASYKDRCLRRRIAVRMRARGAASYQAYARLLDSDGAEYDRLLDALTVNVTRFFRDATTFEVLAREVIPELWRRDGGLHVWSAGTASGEEAYTLAALFHEHALAAGELHRLTRLVVTGSDIDPASIAAARRACYAASAFAETPPSLLDRLFPPASGGLRTACQAVRRVVRFEQRDLLTDDAPAAGLDLVACRNVIIYLARPAQEELIRALHASLRPGGYLVLGRVETLLGEQRRLFETVSARERIYRRPA